MAHPAFSFAEPGDPLDGRDRPLVDPTPMPASFLAGIGAAGPTGAKRDDDHDANLAEQIDDVELRACANLLIEQVKRDRESREPLDKLLDDGIKKLGFDRTTDTRSDYFEGGSAVVHPLMAQSVVDFQARAMRELFPPQGPVRTEIVGEKQRLDAETLAKAERVRRFMNHQVTRVCREWRGSVDEMLMHLPLAGTAITKITWDHVLRRPRRENVSVGYFHCPLGVDSLERAPRYTHEMRLWPDEVREYQRAGLWRDIALPAPAEDETKAFEETARRIVGETKAGTTEDDRHTILEIHCDYRFASLGKEEAGGYEDAEDEAPDDDGAMVTIDLSDGDAPEADDEEAEDAAPKSNGHTTYPVGAYRPNEGGERCPYIVTVEEATGTVLAVRRNWKRDDEYKCKRVWFQVRRMFPWKGIWGLGLLHLIGGLGTAATGALRALMDSAMIHNMPMGLRLRASKATAGRVRMQPMTLAEIDAPGATDIRDVAMPMPFNGPSEVLRALMGEIVAAGRSFASVATQEIVDAGPNMPVGTVLALIEQGSIVYSAIHARLHYAQGEELEILHDLNGQYLDDAETFRDFGGEMVAYRADFDGAVDIVPVSDPAIFSQVQRSAQAQAKLDLAERAAAAGVQVDMRAAFMDVARTLNLPGVEGTFPAPEEAQPLDPVSEVQALLMGRPAKAFPGQNHQAHRTMLRATVADPEYAPQMQMLMPRIIALAADHAALMRREEIELALGNALPPPGSPLPPQVAYVLADAQAQEADRIARERPPLEGYGQDGQDQAAMLLAQAEMLKAQNEQVRIKSNERIKSLEMMADRENLDAELKADLTKLAAQIKADQAKTDAELSADLATIEARTRSSLTIAREGRASQERIASGNMATKIAAARQKPAPVPVPGSKAKDKG